MSENKKYYWLKLKNDFFDDDTITFIEEQENGKDYVLFYLKLCLKSLRDEGKLIRVVGNTLIPYDVNSLSKLTNTPPDTVRVAMNLFKQIGLIETMDSGEIFLSQIKEMIGSETATAERVRRHRLIQKNTKTLQCNTNVTLEKREGNTEIEIEKDIEKEIDIELEIEKDIEIKKDKSVSNETKLKERFEELWKLYPVKQGKDHAYKSYKKAIKEGTADEEILQGIYAYKYYIEKTNCYIKHGGTWFYNKCWQDDYTVTTKEFKQENRRAF